jgi:ABC-2 type transport system ATP-binding protein
MKVLLEASRLSRRFGDHLAVDGLDLSVNAGQVLGLLGPNGAGKSTTLRMLSGCLAPDEGRVRVQGLDLLEQPRAAKALIGYLPERPPVYRDLSVDEYLDFAARLRGVPRGEIDRRVQRVKQRCALNGVGRRLIGNLSKGYQQRVGIAQALVHDPRVVILDEPTAGLDPVQIREVRELIGEIGDRCAVLLSTHILPEVQAICNRATIIHRGRLVHTERLDAPFGGAVSSVLLGLERPPPISELEGLEGVEGVEPIDAHHFRLALMSEAGALAECIATRGWGLIEYTPQRQGLEQTFIRLTTGEGA